MIYCIGYPLRGPGQSASNCCNPDAANNSGYDDITYKAKYCPYFPGDHPTSSGSAPLRIGVLPSKAHTSRFATNSRFRAVLEREAALAQQILEAPDPNKGRRVRQSVAEIVFRNKPFVDYVFHNDLYNTESIVKVSTHSEEVRRATSQNIEGRQIYNGGGVSDEPRLRCRNRNERDIHRRS